MSDHRLGMPPNAELVKKTAAGYVRALHLLAIHKSGGEIPTGLPRKWMDHRGHTVDIIKAAVSDIGLDDLGTAAAVSDSVLEMTRETAILPRLVGTRQVPYNTQFFAQTSAVTASQVDESKGIPVVKGSWAKHTTVPVKVGAICVISNALLELPSLAPAQAVTRDAAQACAEALNAAFVDDVFDGSPDITSTGPDEDLRRLSDLMPSGPGLSWIMCQQTAAYLATIGSSGGGAARFPSITPDGGELLGRQVLISEACVRGAAPVSRVLGLVDPRRIFFTPGRATATRSAQAGLEMSSAPTGATDTPVAASQFIASMFQEEATAIKVVVETGWYAADDAAVFTLVTY